MNLPKSWLLTLVFLALACAGGAPGNTAAIYDEKADAHRDIAAAIANTEASKRIIVLIFGANW